MKLQGTHHYQYPPDLVFKALLDPDVLSRTLPGCEELEQTAENQYAGKLKMKVGPVQGVFKGKVQLLDIEPPHGYRLELEGSGAPGFMNGSGTLRLNPTDGGTDLHYDIDAKVGGKIASIGQRLVESSAKVITRQGLSGLEVQLGRLAAETPQTTVEEPHSTDTDSQLSSAALTTDPPAPVEAPSQAEFAAEFAKGMAEELTPKVSSWVLVAAPILLLAALVAVFLRACT